jgi:hypothetical protein
VILDDVSLPLVPFCGFGGGREYASGNGIRPCNPVTLVTLPHVTDAATMRKISLWRYLAVNRKTLFAVLACASLVISMLGCGASDKLQSIQLSTSNTSETPGSTLTLFGIGGTLQLYTWGNYTNGKQVLLGGTGVAYQISSTPSGFAETGALGDPNAAPPGTVQLSTPSGLLTAVTPFACTYENTASPPATTPAFAVVGFYTVTATYGAFTTPPAFVTLASASGITSTSNPDGLCTNPPTT